MTQRTTCEPRTIHCKGCGHPIIRIGESSDGRLLNASIAGWDWHGGQFRFIVRCGQCGKRRRFRLDDVTH